MKKCIIFAFFALLIPFVAASITFVSLSPSDGTWTNDTTPDFIFKAISDTSTTFSCTLAVGSVTVTNSSVVNDTSTTLTPSSLDEGSYPWYINCTDTNTFQSETRTIVIDETSPQIELVGPANNSEHVNPKVAFSFKATDNLDSVLSCELWVDGTKKDTTEAQNATTKEFDELELKPGNHSWYVECKDEATNWNQSATYQLKIKSYCEEGPCGELKIIEVKKPETGDDFYPGENITVEVKVKNNYDEDLDVEVKAQLYDLNDDDVVREADQTAIIEKDETEIITLYLKVPYSVNEVHDFLVRIKAYEEGKEDSHCDEKAIEVDIKKRSHEVKIEKLELEPATVPCKGSFSIPLEIGNAGKYDEQIKITIANSDLRIDHTEELSLDEGDVRTIDLPSFFVPQDAQEGNYQITVKVYYDYSTGAWHGISTGILTLKVQGNCPGPPQPNAGVSFEQLSEAFSGQSFTIKITVRNTGNVKVNYSIEVFGYEEWANFTALEPSTLELEPGKSGWAILTLEPYENITGNHSLQIKVRFDSKTKEQNITVEVKEVTKPSPKLERWKFELERLWVWLLIIALLTAGVVILTILLYKAQKRAKRAEKRAARAAELRELSLRKK